MHNRLTCVFLTVHASDQCHTTDRHLHTSLSRRLILTPHGTAAVAAEPEVDGTTILVAGAFLGQDIAHHLIIDNYVYKNLKVLFI